MAKGQNQQTKISFETVKKVLLWLLCVFWVAHLVSNIFIDEEIRCYGQNDIPICHCLNTEFKKLNIITKITSLVDDGQLAASKTIAGTKCAELLIQNAFGNM